MHQTTPVGDAPGGPNMDGIEYDERPPFSRRLHSPPVSAAYRDVAPDISLKQSPDLATQRGDGPGNPTQARLGDEGPRGKGSHHTAESDDSEYGSIAVTQGVDTPPTSPEPSACSPRPDRVTDQLARSSFPYDNPTQNGSRPKPKSKSQGRGAPMWPYDHIAGCRKDRKGRRFLKVVWPHSEVPVEEVEGGEEEWNEHRKMARQEQRKQRHQDRLNRQQRASQKKVRRL